MSNVAVQQAREAILAAYRGKRVCCSRQSWPQIRSCMVKAVRFLVNDGDDDAAERVMVEILRLDGVYGLPEGHA